MGMPTDIGVGDGVSVLHSDGHRYECKVKKVDETRIHLHWHGYGKSSSDFWIDLGSDALGPLEDADVPPPPPTRSLKVGRSISTSAGVADKQNTEIDDDKDQSSRCIHCLGDVMEDHLKCDFCARPAHLSCSGLPDYMLVRFLKSETGFMCEACVNSRWSSDKISDTQHLISNIKLKEKEAKQQGADSHTVVSSAAPTSPNVIPICRRFRRGQCPHGMKGQKLVEGKKCAYAHPPKCRKFLLAGNDKKYGCGQGKRCKFLHPILCPSSGKGDGVCSSESCKLVHPTRARRNNDCSDSRNSHSRVTTVNSGNNRGNSDHRATATASTPSKNDQLERIEQMILSMKSTYDKELKALRQELSQAQSPTMPWMVPNYPWMTSPFGGPTPLTSFQQQVPTSYNHRMQHSSF